MALTTDKIKIGDKFYFPNVLNECSDEYGLLTCVKVEVKPEKFQTNVRDWGGYQPKPQYENRNEVIICFVNKYGKYGEIRFWEDDMDDRFHFANTDAEVANALAKTSLNESYSHIKDVIKSEYAKVFINTHRLTNSVDKKQAEKIFALLDDLRLEIGK